MTKGAIVILLLLALPTLVVAALYLNAPPPPPRAPRQATAPRTAVIAPQQQQAAEVPAPPAPPLPPPQPSPVLPPPPLSPKGAKMLTDLLTHLDLNRPELAPVKSADSPSARAKALRDYLRARTHFHHPIDRAQRAQARQANPDPTALTAADNALKNILIASPNYPPYDFGKKIDWSYNATKDSEWRWQLHRMSSWTALAKAYWITGDEKYAQAWARQLHDWVAVNLVEPKPDYAWRTIEAGIRGNGWIGHYQHFVDAEAFTPETCVDFLAACHEHGRYLDAALEKRPDGNNWRLMEAEGLGAIALCFPEFKAAETWRKRSFAVLKHNLPKQVRADGMHYEQCFNYHQGCISWFARTAQLAKLNGYADEFGDDYFKTIEAMCAALLKMAFPDGTMPQFGDGHSHQSCTAVLREWAEFFKRDDFRWAGSGRQEGTPPTEVSTALLDSGFYALRSGWDENATCLVLKCGPDGGWHCQPDNGTFELFAGGRRLMPDSGCYLYHGDADGRVWFRQSRVHQVLTLDNTDNAYAPKRLLWLLGTDFDALVVENAGHKNLTHRRAVLYVKPDLFLLIDDAIGSAAGELRLHFQLLPCTVDLDAQALRARTQLPDGVNLLIAGLPADGRTLVAEDGQVSFNYGKKEPRPAGAFVSTKTADQPAVRFVTVLAPFQGQAPAVKIEPIGDNLAGGDRAEYWVTVNGKTHRLGYDLKTNKAWHTAE